MTREEKENAIHCLKVMIDEEVCEECNLYGTTGTDHCEADCVRVAIEALEQTNIVKDISETEYISDDNSETESEIEPTERMDVLKFIADNAGLSLPEAIELAYVKGYNNAKMEISLSKQTTWSVLDVE